MMTCDDYDDDDDYQESENCWREKERKEEADY